MGPNSSPTGWATWRPGKLLAGAAFAAVLLVWLGCSSVGKPPDKVVRMTLSPRVGTLKRELILSAANRRGLSYLPQTLELTSNGPPFRAYLIDLRGRPSQDQVELFMNASSRIERGEKPLPDRVLAESTGGAQAFFRLHRWPWGSDAHYMLIVACEVDRKDEVEVTARVSYGR